MKQPPKLAATDLTSLFPQFRGLHEIGHGGFKTVFKGTVEGHPEVLKVIGIPAPDDPNDDDQVRFQEECVARVQREVEILSRCKSPFMVKLASVALGEHQINGFTYSIYSEEYLDGPDLWAMIKSKGSKPDEAETKSLNLNGFRVVNGYSDILTPFLAAAGGEAGATGWFNTQKVFSLDRFAPPSPGGRRPVYRYLSARLLNSIRFDELQLLRGRFPEILNDLPTDDYYDPENGSMPNGQLQEVMQTWDAISSFAPNGQTPELSECRDWIAAAITQYEQINLSPGMRLMGRSNGDHLESLAGGLRLFAELAEIDF